MECLLKSKSSNSQDNIIYKYIKSQNPKYEFVPYIPSKRKLNKCCILQ